MQYNLGTMRCNLEIMQHNLKQKFEKTKDLVRCGKNFESLLNGLFNVKNLHLKRIENPYNLEWEIFENENNTLVTNGCKLSFVDNAYIVSNANGNFIDFGNLSNVEYLVASKKRNEKSGFNLSLKGLVQLKHNIQVSIGSCVFCYKDYSLHIKNGFNGYTNFERLRVMPRVYQGSHFDFNDDDILEETFLISKKLIVCDEEYPNTPIDIAENKSFKQFFKDNNLEDCLAHQYLKSENMNFISFDLDNKNGPQFTIRYSRPFSQIAKILQTNNMLCEHYVGKLYDHLKQCEKILDEDQDTIDTCSIYYKYLDIIEEIKAKENNIQFINRRRRYNAMVLEAIERFNKTKKTLLEKKIVEQEDAINLLKDIANNKEVISVFLDIYKIDRSTFNKKYSRLETKYLNLAKALYGMDCSTREFLLVSNGIYN